jgi:putative lipoic acid-binding regulatory protein
MKEAKVEYPCWWTYAIIGPDEEELRLAAGAVTRGRDHKIKFSKESSQKHYVSLHIDVWVLTEAERNEIFQTFKNDPRIRMVL